MSNIQCEVSKYGVCTVPYFPAFGLNESFSSNARKYGPEKTSYSETFHAVIIIPQLNSPLHRLKHGI